MDKLNREKIHNIGVEIATLAVREYEGEAENYIDEFGNLIAQLLATLDEEEIRKQVDEARIKIAELSKKLDDREEDLITAKREERERITKLNEAANPDKCLIITDMKALKGGK